MATIDIRATDEKVDKIVFSSATYEIANSLELDSRVVILKNDEDDYMNIQKADVQNLIKALQKAVELGWTK
jgi:hypothetical protein